MNEHQNLAAEPKPTSLATIVVFLALAGLVLFSILRFRGPPAAAEHPAVGKSLGPLELQPLDEALAPLDSQSLTGKVVLINYWGPWCGYCLQELPSLAALAKQLKDRADFRVVTVACDRSWVPGSSSTGAWQEDLAYLQPESAKAMQRLGIALPVYVDRQGISRDAFAAWGGWDGYPTTIVVDRTGVIRGVWIGYVPGDERQVERLVYELLASVPKSAGHE